MADGIGACVGRWADSSAHSLEDSALESLFEQADDFLEEVGEIQTIIAQYTATSTTGKKAKNYIDEIGCFAPVGVATMAPSQTLFWNACGGMYAYLFGHFTVLGVEYAGTSQLMAFPEIKGKDLARLFPSRPAGTDIPTQVPSVTMPGIPTPSHLPERHSRLFPQTCSLVIGDTSHLRVTWLNCLPNLNCAGRSGSPLE